VIGVGHNPSRGRPWWAADGTPIAAPYRRIDVTLRNGDRAARPRSPRQERIVQALEEETYIHFDGQPLSDVVGYLQAFHSQGPADKAIKIELDRAALAAAGVATDTPVTKKLTDVTLKAGLRSLLKEFDLTYITQDDVLLITTIDKAEDSANASRLPVADLVSEPLTINRELALRWIQRPQDVTVQVSENSSLRYGNCRAFDADGKELPDVRVIAAQFPKTQQTCDLHFKIAVGPWETLQEVSGRGSVTGAGNGHAYAFSPAVENNGATQITMSHDVLDRDIRIVAVDHQDHEIPSTAHGGGNAQGLAQRTAAFHKLPLKDIKAFRLQARDWQTAEITGIALNAGPAMQPAVKTAD
jgi:hypothetical protein